MEYGNGRDRVVWINGAFGAGKTTTARLLAQSVPGSVLIDPEEVGSMLRPVLQPVTPVRDFQEWNAWRELVAATLNAVMRELPEDGPRLAIVPQTITNEAYWSQITAALDPAIELLPIALHVSPDEHRRRATEDSEEPDALQWRLRRFEGFRDADWIRMAFAGIDTSQLSPTAAASAVHDLLDKAAQP
jgi:hypothetical protein